MKTVRTLPISAALLLLAACQETTEPPGPSGADGVGPTLAVRLNVPEDHPGNPFYSPIHDIPGVSFLFPHTEEWGAAPFERELSCVPPGFNLLDVFDPGSFSCALTVEGFQIWDNPPTPFPVDPGPLKVLSRGLGAVPIVFAHWNEIQLAMSDAVLTLPELLNLSSAIVGTADHYVANYVNGPLPLGFVMQKIVASGTLPDGRSFRVHAGDSQGGVRNQIVIR